MKFAKSAAGFERRIVVDPLVENLLYSIGMQKLGGYVRCWMLPNLPVSGRCWGLHVVTWTILIGRVPPGWHVHHKDSDPLNNDLGNLEALPGPEHLRRTHLGMKKPYVSRRMAGVPKSAEHRAKISAALRKYFDGK